MSIPPDGSPTVTRPRAPETAERGRGVAAAVVTVVGCALVVLVLGWGVHAAFAPELRMDTAVSRALYAGDGRSAALDDLLHVITAPGLTVFRLLLAIPVLLLLWRRRAWLAAVWVVVAVAAIGPITTLIKNGVGRLRPQFANGGAHLQSLSYPSGHSSGIATTVTVGLILAWPLLTRTGRRIALVIGVVLVVVVGCSRMWLGVHYLTDVIAGWSLGIAWALLTALVFGALPGGRAALPPRT